MNNITRTIYNSYLQTCLLFNLSFTMTPNTTLNEKFNNNSGVAPAAGKIPTVAYWAIGNGGHQLSVGANGLTKTEPVQHLATDAELYNHLPFVLRPLTNDLTTQQQTGYAMRVIQSISGVSYAAYYLKRINLTGLTAAMELITVANGVSTPTPFVPNSSNLNPTPQTLSSSGVNVVSGNYADASVELDLSLAEFDVTEFLNVAQIIYGDPGYAIISEVALCSGLDKQTTATGLGNSTFAFNDAIAVQVCTFINTMFALEYANDGVDLNLDVGATEPLYKIN